MGVAEPNLTVCLSARQVAEKANLRRSACWINSFLCFRPVPTPTPNDVGFSGSSGGGSQMLLIIQGAQPFCLPGSGLLLAPRRTKCFIEILMTA